MSADTKGETMRTINDAELAEILARHKNGVRADLCNANLCGADLSYASLDGADLRDANLCGADLSYAILDGAILCDCNFHGAKISYRGRIVTVRFIFLEIRR